jgi:hypothetical protein
MANAKPKRLSLEWFQEQGRRGGQARTAKKSAASKRNAAKARAAKLKKGGHA